VDSKLKLLDAALKDLDMGQGNNFLSMRATMLDARGQVRKDLYKPNGDVHLNISGTKIASLRIRNMLEIMLPTVFPVQAQVPVQAPGQDQIQAPVAVPVVVHAPLVVAGVQQLVGQIQDLVVQNVNIVQPPPVVMEVEENDNDILKRLFLQRFGRALPEQERERNEVDEIVGNMDLIDLTNDDDEMEVATPVQTVVVVKTETPEAAPIDDCRRSSRLERIGKSLRKTDVIPEKEAPAETVIADTRAAAATAARLVGPYEADMSGDEVARSVRAGRPVRARAPNARRPSASDRPCSRRRS
jgi:hypothetical protein